MNKKVLFKDLGLIDYKKCWDYQEALFAGILDVKSNNRKSKGLNFAKIFKIKKKYLILKVRL